MRGSCTIYKGRPVTSMILAVVIDPVSTLEIANHPNSSRHANQYFSAKNEILFDSDAIGGCEDA